MRKAALEQGDPRISQILTNMVSDTTTAQDQVAKLRQLYHFCHGAAVTIATLAYRVAR
jgi:hypothetical protein